MRDDGDSLVCLIFICRKDGAEVESAILFWGMVGQVCQKLEICAETNGVTRCS